MGRKKNNIIGKKYDNLLVTGEGYSSNKGFYWELTCDCGEICFATSTDLNRGRRNFCKSCGEKKSYLTVLKCLYDNYRRGAIKRNLDFSLNIEEFEKLINKNCNYCNLPPSQIYTKKWLKSEVIYNGIDREDNLSGYDNKNSVPCCKYCNFAKRASSKEELLEWIEFIRNSK